MREQLTVSYELELMNEACETITESFDIDFDLLMYEEDIESMDIMMMQTKLQELRKAHGSLMMVEMTIDRNGYELK